MRKNNKGEMSIPILIAAALGLLIFIISVVVFINDGIMNRGGGGIITVGEEVTQDCDGDGKRPPVDDCPCVKAIQDLEEGQTCGEPDSQASIECRKRCKPIVLA